MLGPRFIPESVFYTQSVMLSPRVILLTNIFDIFYLNLGIL